MKAMSNEKVRNVVNDINEAKDKFMSKIVDFTDDDEVKDTEAEPKEAKKKKDPASKAKKSKPKKKNDKA